MVAAAPAAPVSNARWLADLAGAPLPSRRQEDWRFTDLTALTALAPQLLEPTDPLAGITLPAGVTRLSAAEAEPWLGRALAAADCAHHWPVRLNLAAQPALVALRVTAAVDQPLVLPIQAGPEAGLRACRLLLVLERGARLALLLQPGSSAANALSLVSEVVLEADAELDLGNLALGAAASCLLQHTAVLQAAGSRFAHTSVTGGWAFSRQEPRIVQLAGAAHTRLRGLQVCRGQQLADTHSSVRFDGPEGELDQLHKVVADGQGRSVFNGAVRVPQAAQRTNASQLSRTLLLSDRARIDTKPELEIVADDVKCAHGATVSRLQIEELFYLQSRGIAAAEAAQLLQRAFCEEVLRALPAGGGADDAILGQRPMDVLLAGDGFLAGGETR